MLRHARLLSTLTTVFVVATPAVAWGQVQPSLPPPPPPATATVAPPWQTGSLPPPPPPAALLYTPAPAPVYVGRASVPGVRYDPSPGTRRLLEGLGGLGVGIGFALGGALIGYGAASSSRDPWTGAVLSGGIALILGIPFGVTVVGRARGGNGGYGWSLLGSFAGLLALSAITWGITSECRGDCAGGVVATSALMLLLPTAGAVIAYELSNDQNGLPEPPGARVRLAPMLQFGQGGGLVGVGATF